MAGRRIHGRGIRPADLPPGDERREAAAQATDELAERAETLGGDGGAINPNAFKVENELAQHFNILAVTNQDPAYRYGWIYLGQYGLQIKMKLAQGWEVVQGDMLEAVELKGIGADTTRKLGDVMLMRCRMDRYLALQRIETVKRGRQEEGIAARFQEILGPYHKRYGATAIVNGQDVMTGERVDARRLDHMWKRSQAAAAGTKIVDTMLRDGRMPGVPATSNE